MVAGTVTASGNESQLATTTSLGTTVTGVWNGDTSTNRFGVAIATGNGISIDSNGSIQANESVVDEGKNIAISSSNDGRVTTYSVSGYNATTTAGPISGATSNSTSNGVTVSSKYNSTTQTTAYGVEVATGDNINIDSNDEISGLKTTISARDPAKMSVIASGGFDENNNFTTNYEVGINITDRAFDALNCTGSASGAECYGKMLLPIKQQQQPSAQDLNPPPLVQ